MNGYHIYKARRFAQHAKAPGGRNLRISKNALGAGIHGKPSRRNR